MSFLKNSLIYVLIIFFMAAFPVFSDTEIDEDLELSVRMIFNDNRLESVAVVYPRVLSISEILEDKTALKNNMSLVNYFISSVNSPINGEDTSSICLIMLRNSLYRAGRGKVLEPIILTYKRFKYINVTISGDFNKIDNPLFVYNGDGIHLLGYNTDSSIKYKINISDHNIRKISLPNGQTDKIKYKKNNIMQVIVGTILLISVIILLLVIKNRRKNII